MAAEGSLERGASAAGYSVILNIILTTMKGVVGYLSGNIALLADAFHSLADLFASAAVLFGLKLSQREPDELFPYGYYRVETLVSLIVSLIIIFTGIEIAIDSLEYIRSPPAEISMPFISLAVTFAAIVASYLIGAYKERVGREINSTALLNDGRHSYIDVISSLVVFTSILAEYAGLSGVQGIAGILVSALIIYMGLKLTRDDVLVLLDACIDRDSLELLRETVIGVEGVEGVHDIKIRKSGPYLFGELHIEVPRDLSTEDVDEIISRIKREVKTAVPSIDHITIQPETFKRDYLVVAVPLEDDRGLKSHITSHFGKAKFFIIAKTLKGRIIDFRIIENTARSLKTKRGIKAAELLKKEDVDVLVLEEISEGPSYVFGRALLGTTPPDGSSLEEVIVNASRKFSQNSGSAYG